MRKASLQEAKDEGADLRGAPLSGALAGLAAEGGERLNALQALVLVAAAFVVLGVVVLAWGFFTVPPSAPAPVLTCIQLPGGVCLRTTSVTLFQP